HPFESAADRPAADRANHRPRPQHERPRDILDALDIGPGFRFSGSLRAELLEIVAGAEGPAFAGKHDGTHLGITIGGIHRFYEVVEQLRHDGIESMRPIERYQLHAIAQMVAEHGLGHDCLLITRRVLPSFRGRLLKAHSESLTVTP